MTQPGALMAAEIDEQPEVWERILADGRRGQVASVAAGGSAATTDTVLFVARGTSDHAALYAKYLIEIDARLPCRAGVAVDHDGLRRPARPERRADDRGDPVRRVARPGAVAGGGR